MLAFIVSVAVYQGKLYLIGVLNITDIHILALCRCLRYVHANRSGVPLINDMEYVRSLPSKGHFINMESNNLKLIYLQDPH